MCRSCVCAVARPSLRMIYVPVECRSAYQPSGRLSVSISAISHSRLSTHRSADDWYGLRPRVIHKASVLSYAARVSCSWSQRFSMAAVRSRIETFQFSVLCKQNPAIQPNEDLRETDLSDVSNGCCFCRCHVASWIKHSRKHRDRRADRMDVWEYRDNPKTTTD